MGLAVALLAYSGDAVFARALDFVEADFRDKLRRLRRNTKYLRRNLIVWTVAVAVVFLTMWLALGLLVVGFAISALLVSLPWYLVRRMAERRREQIEDQLADAMVSLSSSVKAGLSLAQSMDILAQQSPAPICQEFQQMVGEYQLGKPLERCLEETKQRLRSENFALFAAALLASRESGGRLNETVDRIAQSVLEMQRLERKIRSETAQARSSAVYMALAPAIILVAYYFVDPINTERLFTTVPGQIILSISLILNVTAYLWARKILNPDI